MLKCSRRVRHRPPSPSNLQLRHAAASRWWLISLYISRWDFGHIKSWNTLSAPASDHFNMLTCTWTRQHRLLWWRPMRSRWSLRFVQRARVCVCVSRLMSPQHLQFVLVINSAKWATHYNLALLMWLKVSPRSSLHVLIALLAVWADCNVTWKITYDNCKNV